MGNLASYNIRGKWFLTTAAFSHAGASIAEEEGDYVSDAIDLAELSFTVGAIWYGEALLGYAISNPTTTGVIAIFTTGAVVSYGIDGWKGVTNYLDYLEDIYTLDVESLVDKGTFTATVVPYLIINKVQEFGKVKEVAATYERPAVWKPQPLMPAENFETNLSRALRKNPRLRFFSDLF